MVVNDINNVSLSIYNTVLKEINDSRKEFEDTTYRYETRKSNKEADFLAKLALSLPIGWHVWLLPSPDLYSYPKIWENIWCYQGLNATAIRSSGPSDS